MLTTVSCNQRSPTIRIRRKSNLSLYSLDYAEACNEFAGPISASLRPGNTAPFEEMSQRWRAIGNTVPDLTGPSIEPQISRSRDERISARPTGRLYWKKLRIKKFNKMNITRVKLQRNSLFLHGKFFLFFQSADKYHEKVFVFQQLGPVLNCFHSSAWLVFQSLNHSN